MPTNHYADHCPVAVEGDTMHADAENSNCTKCTPKDRDHHFTGTQQAEYDSLKWRGRDAYDNARWHLGADHEQAHRVGWLVDLKHAAAKSS